MLGNRQNHHLDGGNLGRQHQAVVVTVGHDDAANETGGHAPGGLEGVDTLVVLIGKGDVKCLGEAIAEVVGSTCLQSLLIMHHALDGVGGLGAVELFLVGLLAPGNGHGQHVLAEVGIQVQHLLSESLGLLCAGVHGMTLLPQKLPMAQEGTAGLLPTQHTAPLVILHRQIPMGLNDLCEMIAEQRLRGGTDAHSLFQFFVAAHGNPGALGGEAFYMVLFLLQQAFRNQHGHIDILHAHLFEFGIHDALDVLPDRIAIGAVNEYALDGGIVNELRLFAHVGVPLGEVHLHVGDLLNFFILCHDFHPLRLVYQMYLIYYSTFVNRMPLFFQGFFAIL